VTVTLPEVIGEAKPASKDCMEISICWWGASTFRPVPTSLPERLRTVIVAPAPMAVLLAMTSELEVCPSSMKMGATRGLGSISVRGVRPTVLCASMEVAG
jgi:hypothetical protein